MQPLKSMVGDVESAVTSGEDSQRIEILRKVTDLFVEQAPALKDEHVGVYDEVILRLAHKIEFRARVELAERLAGLANAPVSTVRHLAFDEKAEVAAPVIERSPRLSEDDLVHIAQERGQGHLQAMARRANLTERVTDVLVVRGDRAVLRTVAANETAKFSEMGFGTMVQRSALDSELQQILQGREDIPPNHVEALVFLAKERAKQKMQGNCESGDCEEALSTAIETVAEKVARESGPVVMLQDAIEAVTRITDLANQGLLAEDQIVQMVKAGKMADALAGLARMAQMPLEAVVNAYGAPHYDQILFIVRSLRFSWPSFKALLTVKFGGNPPQTLLQNAFKSFETLSVPTAQRVMRFVTTRKKLAGAASTNVGAA